MLTPAETSSPAMEVARKLRTEILVGNIKPGERILEQEGLIVREPSRSATVVSMTLDDVEEECSLRLALESLALRYAVGRTQERDYEKLMAVNAELERFTLQGAVDLDLQFHEEAT